MKKWFVSVLLASAAAGPSAATTWFTVVGDPSDPKVDTVEVDPVAITTAGGVKNMYMRVNRSKQRFNWDKLPYRSYEARIAFDCNAKKGDYMVATFYPEPRWTGLPVITTDYTSAPKPLELRDMEPNPTERIIRAACRPAGK
ncbi:surface-adhesin E family protein [Variovorax rhizosphaerae]|uniref:Surface-adhesin E family protein n=1 Tax=Variovorax rhizosphaerae TaxID=1836200 RepID=A0ABU8WPI0_9BURK